MRFTRVIEEEAVNFYKKIADVINQAFMDQKVVGVIAGGSGPTKYAFMDGPWINNNVKKKIVGTVDTVDRNPLHQQAAHQARPSSANHRGET